MLWHPFWLIDRRDGKFRIRMIVSNETTNSGYAFLNLKSLPAHPVFSPKLQNFLFSTKLIFIIKI